MLKKKEQYINQKTVLAFESLTKLPAHRLFPKESRQAWFREGQTWMRKRILQKWNMIRALYRLKTREQQQPYLSLTVFLYSFLFTLERNKISSKMSWHIHRIISYNTNILRALGSKATWRFVKRTPVKWWDRGISQQAQAGEPFPRVLHPIHKHHSTPIGLVAHQAPKGTASSKIMISTKEYFTLSPPLYSYI